MVVVAADAGCNFYFLKSKIERGIFEVVPGEWDATRELSVNIF